MRITNEMILANTLQDLQNNENRIATYQAQLSSGKKLVNVSDDPIAAARVLALRTTVDTNAQYLTNINAANSWLSATDTALSSVNTVLVRAQELAVQGANGSLSASDRQAIAAEVDSLVGEVAQVGNTTHAGSYIFAGAQTDSQPFSSSNGVVTYNNVDPVSATKQLTRVIGPGTQIIVNVIGHDPSTQQGVFDQTFGALTGLSQALKANDTTGIQASIAQLSDAHSATLSSQATVGASLNRLTAAGDQLNALQLQLASWRSSLEDTNYAQAATSYTEATVIRSATLASMGKAIPPTLFDYMR